MKRPASAPPSPSLSRSSTPPHDHEDVEDEEDDPALYDDGEDENGMIQFQATPSSSSVG